MSTISMKGQVMPHVKANFYGGPLDGHVEVVEKAKVLEVADPTTGENVKYRLHLGTIPLAGEPGFAIYVPDELSSEEAKTLVRQKLPNRSSRD